MRYRGVATIYLGLAMVWGLATPQTARAVPAIPQPTSANEIHVTGRVPERRWIIVDGRGMIQQFFSNTDKPVSPIVSIGAIGGPTVPFTPVLQRQYAQLFGQLKDNRVVSVQVNTTPFSLEYPDFTRSVPAQVFTVTPTPMPGDKDASPYEISMIP